MSVHGILLAAGRSRRFGSDKRTHRLPDGRTVMAHSLDKLLQACDRVWIVLHPDDPADILLAGLASSSKLIADAVGCGRVHVHFANEADLGMGHSLSSVCRCLSTIAQTPSGADSSITGVLVALADMPFIAPATFSAVKAALAGGATIAAPIHGVRRGHPVGFHPTWLDALSNSTGDEGARQLLGAQAHRITLIPVDDSGIHQDIDHPADLG